MKTVVLLACILTLVLGASAQTINFATRPTQWATPEMPPQSASQLARIEGFARDEHTHAALVGAIVSWRRGEQGMRGTTDENGRFAFALPAQCAQIPPNATSGDALVVVSVDANRYVPKEQTVLVCTGRNRQLEFMLKPFPPDQIAVVSGTVTNSWTHKGVAGVSVAILNAGGILQATTGKDGSYSIAGVGFRHGAMILMNTPVQTDDDSKTPCLTPMERTFDASQQIVEESFATSPPLNHSTACPLNPIVTPRITDWPPTTLPNDDTIQWQQGDQFSILLEPPNNSWNSQLISDIIRLDESAGFAGFVVSTDRGGVWAIEGLQGYPLSFNWNSIDINTLAYGPDLGQDIFAGTYGVDGLPGGILWETDTSALFPLLNWSQVNQKPPCDTISSHSINKILVVAQTNHIVLACDNGLFWSEIPPSGVKGTYVWHPAILAPGIPPLPSLAFSDMTQGPGMADNAPRIVASLHGGNTPQQMIYVGQWQKGDLVLTPGSVPTLFQGQAFGRTSLAACPTKPSIMYALAADGDDQGLGGVWRSADAGSTWDRVNQPSASTCINCAIPDPGTQGYYNQAIAVSPLDCDTVAVAFRTVGPYVSFDGGKSYEQPNDNGAGHQHSDLHAVLFDPEIPTILYVGSDGGMLAEYDVIEGQTPTFESDFNRKLVDLLVNHVAASSQSNGLVAVATKDNGIDDAQLPPFGPGRWEQQIDSDGDYVEFVTPVGFPPRRDVMLFAEHPDVSRWEAAIWNGNRFESAKVIPVETIQNQRDPDGIRGGPISHVRDPIFANKAGQLMYAVTGTSAPHQDDVSQFVYGLFANDDGGDMHWELIGEVGANENVTAVSSYDGLTVFVGTDHLHIFELDSPFSGTPTSLTINNPIMSSEGTISSIVDFSPLPLRFAALSTLGQGFVLGWQGQQWEALGGGLLPSNLPFYAVAAADPASLFALSRTSVFVSHDSGATWATANDGLPAVPQGNDLYSVLQPDGTRYLYMATYGRSVWRAKLP